MTLNVAQGCANELFREFDKELRNYFFFEIQYKRLPQNVVTQFLLSVF